MAMHTTMLAAHQEKSGGPEVIELREVPIPVPGDTEILVKVHTATLTQGDVMLRKMPRWLLSVVGAIAGFKTRRISGTEFCGEVVKVGFSVTRFREGDWVCGTTTGLKDGAHATYVKVPQLWKQGVVAALPSGAKPDDAAAFTVGALTAHHLLKKAGLKAGDHLVVYGASGSVGSMGVQIAVQMGARVTAVCSTRHLDWVKELGADRVVDYKWGEHLELTDPVDIVLDAVGKSRKSEWKTLKPKGKYTSIRQPTSESDEAYDELLSLLAKGLLKVHIDREYPLAEIQEANRYVEGFQKAGHVIVRP